MSESLYFMALLPPSEIQKEIKELKHEIAERFGSSQALKSPAHITMHMPFRWKDKKIEQLKEAMSEINEGMDSIQVELKDFGFFEPRVVYVNVVENEPLRLIQKSVIDICKTRLNLLNSNYKDQVFRPHMTIAFRDLKKPMFYEAQEYYQKKRYISTFRAMEVTLLKHDGTQWQSMNLAESM